MAELADSYWAATAIPALDTPPLEASADADVCVIGGGFLGLSTALHLAETGASVIVLEAEEPGWGASGRNGGQIIPGWKVEHAQLVRQHGQQAADRITNWAGSFVDMVLDLVAKHGIDCGASRSGWVQAAHSYELVRAQQRRAEYLQARGADVDVIGAVQAGNLIGTNWYKGAFVDRRGGRLHPLSYARGLAHAAAKSGVRIFGCTPATRLRRQGGGWHVTTPHGQVTAGQVVLCTNAYTDAMGGEPLVPNLKKSVIALQSYMVATNPLGSNLRRSILPNGEVVSDAKKLMHHFRLEEDGRLLFGGRGGLRDKGAGSAFAPLLEKLPVIFPQLSDVPIAYRWSGKVAITIDGGPHLHRPAPGLTLALGCNGRGVGMCTATGKLIAELLNGLPDAESPMPITAVRSIPFHALRMVGLQSAVWFKGWQDRRDYARTA